MAQADLSGKTCLVTGASGFIGSILCAELKIRGASVKALLHSNVHGPWEDGFVCELGQQNIPAQMMQGVDIVFHLAARAHALSDSSTQESLYFKTNVDGTHDLLKAAGAAGVEKFILFSSVKAMGEECNFRLNEESNAKPLTIYGKSKLEAEKLVLDGGYVTASTVLRLSMVYGNSVKGNLPKMINAISRNRFPPFPKIQNKRSMIHVEDVVQAAILAATNKISAGKTYILSDGIDYSTRELYEKICESINKKIPGWEVPIFILNFIAKFGDVFKFITKRRFFIDSDSLQKLIGNAYYDSSKIQLELGFTPKHTLFAELENIIMSLNLR